MPTPVTAARQCLTGDASAALDDAASVARRRGHPQTTSLHMVASLLALPSSSLREACTRAQNRAYDTRVQFKALELSLGVALDRLPSSKASRIDSPPPPVSNSLMAAIKRSQANQRRHPEGFGFHHHPSPSSSSSTPALKIELPNLTLSILDDPLVSRVLGDAGFRSYDVKIATISKKIINNNSNKPHPQYLYGYYSSRYNRHNRNRNPPLFLCHSSYGFSFPFMGCNESSRKIGEVMLRNKKRNPLLLGVSAVDALRTFLRALESKARGVFSVVCVEDEVSRFVNGDCDDGPLKSKFEEVWKLLGDFSGQGVVLSFGDFEVFFGDGGVCLESLRFLVGKLGRLLEDGKVWLIGAADSYEVFSRVLNRFPSVEVEWDMGILPVDSLEFSTRASNPRSSLMESFVPLGGFFSMPSETKGSLSSASCQNVTRCHLCNEKCNQEVSALSNDGLCSPLAAIKAKDDDNDDDDSLSLTARIARVHQKWDTICQHHHHPPFQENMHLVSSSSTHFQPRQEPHSSDPTSNNTSHPIILPQNSAISVSTDLNLGQISYSSTCEFAGLPSAKCYDNLYRALVERIGRQEEAIGSVVEAITQSQTTTSARLKNGDHIWINLSGPDRLSKKKLGLALAETLYRTTESFVYVDLSFSDEITAHADNNNNNNKLSNKYDLNMRGTVVDYLVEKLSVNPRIVFLENIDKSDHVVQNRLSRALKTGRLTDLRGREVKASNSIFVATTSFIDQGSESKFSEENVLNAKGRPIRISVGFDLNDDPRVEHVNGSPSSDVGLMNKRKRGHVASDSSYLDLNLPARTSEKTWIDDFNRQIDRVVVFKPLDFDEFYERLFENMSRCLHEIVGSKCTLEVEFCVMRQIIAAAYIFGDKSVEYWIMCVLRKGFSEAMGMFWIDERSIVKLVSCHEEIEGHLLPGGIVIN